MRSGHSFSLGFPYFIGEDKKCDVLTLDNQSEQSDKAANLISVIRPNNWFHPLTRREVRSRRALDGSDPTVGMLGLLLASMGIFGAVSYIVVLRTREIGIWIALRAQKDEILGLMLRESTRPVFAGFILGVTLSVGTSYLMRGILDGVNLVNSISPIGVSLASVGQRDAATTDPV